MKSNFLGFPHETLKFFRELKQNNNREWFLTHKHIYEGKVKKPMIEFLLALKPELAKFAPEILVDPAKCIFRIYRDIRFSQDKSPYKTHIAASFQPKDFGKRPAAGLYFHLGTDEVFLGGGLYMPGSQELMAIRKHIAVHHKKLRKIISDSPFNRLFGEMKGEQLIRPPKGFPADHPAADLLRYKQYLAYVALPSTLAHKPDVVTQTVKYFRGMVPLVRYLNVPLKSLPAKLRAF